MDEPRRVVGEYSLGKVLGKGSFAIVWKGSHLKSGREVAVKEINVKQLSAKLRQSLECEVSILQKVEHQNIVRLLDTFEDKDHMYLVMEFCSGGDLAHYIRRYKRVSEATAHGLLSQLAAGLREMWAHNFVHRDLKPQNLLLSDSSPQAVLTIADFGFARDLQPQGLAETLCGSPLYMAPEILQFRKYDAKADLWSIGTILYELLVGHPPFTGDNHVQLLRNIERHVPHIPTSLQLSPSCRHLLAMLLKKNPVERISFEEFFTHPWLTAAGVAFDDIQLPLAAADYSRSSNTSDSSSNTRGGFPFSMDSSASRIDSAYDASAIRSDSPALLLSSTRLDAMMGPLIHSSESQSQLAHSISAPRHAAVVCGSHDSTTRSEGNDEHEMEEGYVVVSGPPPSSAIAAARYHQPRSPTSMASMKLRSFAAMLHPLAAHLSHTPSLRAGDCQLSTQSGIPLPRIGSVRAPQQCSPQSASRNPVRRSISAKEHLPTASKSYAAPLSSTPQQSPHRHSNGSSLAYFPRDHYRDDYRDSPLPHQLLAKDHVAALEQVVSAFENVAEAKSHGAQHAHSLAFRLIAIQLLQLGIAAETASLLKLTNVVATRNTFDEAVSEQQAQPQPQPQPQPKTANLVTRLGTSRDTTWHASKTNHDSLSAAPSALDSNVVELPHIKDLAMSIEGNRATALIKRLKAKESCITSHAVHDASALSRSGAAAATTPLPDVWEAAYNAALDLSQAAAVDETLGELKAAAHIYGQAVAIMHFLACIAGCLPLEPRLQLSPQQVARVQHYYAAISKRAAAIFAVVSATTTK